MVNTQCRCIYTRGKACLKQYLLLMRVSNEPPGRGLITSYTGEMSVTAKSIRGGFHKLSNERKCTQLWNVPVCLGHGSVSFDISAVTGFQTPVKLKPIVEEPNAS